LIRAGTLAAGAPQFSDNKGKIEGTEWLSLPGKIKGQDLPAGILKREFGKDGKLTDNAGPVTLTGTYLLARVRRLFSDSTGNGRGARSTRRRW
jgi:hypothetical protein